MEEVSGYAHPAYAASLSEFGAPRLLPGSGGWILERSIDGFPCLDAMGCYPFFSCQDWSQLRVDLEQISEGLVCLSLVTDPFGAYDVDYLRRCFPDVMVPFKEHFAVDLSRPVETFAHTHHRRNARKALREIDVKECTDPVDFLDDWINLYCALIERHDITGIAAFSRECFAKQFRVPGFVAFRAVEKDNTVGMLLWYAQGNRAYYHLGAYSAVGYKLGASFALFDYAIGYFAQKGLSWLSLGAGAGTNAESGLSRFKRGWSTGVRPVYFCGRIFDKTKYREIVSERSVPGTDYFPAYRAGEFS